MGAESSVRRIGVFGASGSGKSTYAKALIRKSPRVVAFDPLDEYGEEGFERVRTVQGVIDAARRSYGRFRVAYVPPDGNEPAALSRLCRAVQKIQEPAKAGRGRDLTLLVEELNLSFPVSGGAEKCKGFANLCSRGRHWRVEIIGLSQRIAEVSTRFRGNLSVSVVFRQSGPRDLSAAADTLGFVNKSQIQGLRNHSYIRVEAGEIKKGQNAKLA